MGAPPDAWRGTPPEEVPPPVRKGVEGLFSALARARSGRAFHPRGAVFSGRLEPVGGGDGLPFLQDGDREALVRLSKAAGLPSRLPDVYGLSFRVPDAYGPGAHQDLLLATAGGAPVGRHVLRPARGFDRRRYTSLLPYRHGHRLILLGARAVRRRAAPLALEELDSAAVAGEVVFELAVGGFRGPWRPVALLTLARAPSLPAEAAERLRFHPWRTAADLHPVGPLSRVRAPAYDGSHRAATSP